MTVLSPLTREKLMTVSSGTLTTVLFRRGLRTRYISGVLPLDPACARFAGPAFTLRFIPAREDIDTMERYASADHVQRRAIEECPPGAVLVISTGNECRAASAGDIMIARLQQRGVVAAVTDGGFRDTPDIRALGFPVFQRQPAVPSSPIALHPADLDRPVGCGGVAVFPGDIVVGDGDGVVVIPAGIADEIADEAINQTQYEDFVTEKVAEGRSIFGLFPPDSESLREFEIWKAGRP
ncbi:ribonuclease activity regulator RraA [Frigidibacter sp. SD6-1]|uniref:ribonuclease activity regulator RraA n=1 Tax=Frigidibacter sp. SD6-1 TaxID=3032581 RepID=UPI0024DF9C5C|nr:ribonuclease activity regulator RraA [Frigidibacter sp. SD6-1]